MKEITRMKKALAKVIRIELERIDRAMNTRLEFLAHNPDCNTKDSIMKTVDKLQHKYDDLSLSLVDIEDMDDIKKDLFDELVEEYLETEK
jgi:hypothetical protein